MSLLHLDLKSLSLLCDVTTLCYYLAGQQELSFGISHVKADIVVDATETKHLDLPKLVIFLEEYFVRLILIC